MAEKGAPDDVPEPLFCGLNGGYYTYMRADSPHPSPTSRPQAKEGSPEGRVPLALSA